MLVDRPVQVGPLATDLGVGLVDTPTRRALAAPLPAQPLLDLRCISWNPAIDRLVINRHFALAHHLLDISVADPIPAVPTHRPEHDLTLEVASLEVRHDSALLARADHAGRRQSLQQTG